MACGVDLARRTQAGGNAGRKATWQSRASPRGGGADVWQGPHESMRMSVRGATWRERGWHLEGPRVSGAW